MKIKKFNESTKFIPSNDEEMISFLENIISWNIELRLVRYGQNDEMEIDPNSVISAAKDIMDEFKEIGIDFDMFYSTKKYNI